MTKKEKKSAKKEKEKENLKRNLRMMTLLSRIKCRSCCIKQNDKNDIKITKIINMQMLNVCGLYFARDIQLVMSKDERFGIFR